MCMMSQLRIHYFPLGVGEPFRGGANFRRDCFSAEMYAKTNEGPPGSKNE